MLYTQVMNLIIRFALPTDFETVRAFDPHSDHIATDKIKTKLASHEIILALDADKPVGMIRFSYLWSVRPYMDLIWVAEELRGKQIGTQLLAFLEEYLLREGYTCLYTSSQENEPAPQKWHMSHGFQKCGVLSTINFPDPTNEVFFYKHLGTGDPTIEELKRYPVLP